MALDDNPGGLAHCCPGRAVDEPAREVHWGNGVGVAATSRRARQVVAVGDGGACEARASLFDGAGGRRPVRAALRSLGLNDAGTKRGFAVPLFDWLRGPLRPWAESLLTDDAEDPLDQGTIRQNWLDLLAGRRDLATGIWTVISWRAWLRSRP